MLCLLEFLPQSCPSLLICKMRMLNVAVIILERVSYLPVPSPHEEGAFSFKELFSPPYA